MPSSQINILNYGAGAVGLGLDSFLLQAGVKLTIVAKPTTVKALRDSGLKRVGIFGEYFAGADQFQSFSSLEEIPLQKFDYILVSTKSFDSPLAAADLHSHPKLLDQHTQIILCQNGWGNAEIFQKYFPALQIFNARIITGFERIHPNEVALTVHADAIHLGSIFTPDQTALKPLAELLSLGGIPAETTADIARDLWAKMLYNCALNSLGAIFNVPYGELGKSPYSRALMRDIMSEIFAVMATGGFQTHWTDVESYEKMFYEKFLPPTAGHYSSTLQDLKNGKPTEIDALNGVIVDLADTFHISADANRCAYRMVKFLEERNKAEKRC